MPMRLTASRDTKKAEKTRPRETRGVLRWRMVRREMPEGAFRKPVAMTMTIATQMFGDSP